MSSEVTNTNPLSEWASQVIITGKLFTVSSSSVGTQTNVLGHKAAKEAQTYEGMTLMYANMYRLFDAKDVIVYWLMPA